MRKYIVAKHFTMSQQYGLQYLNRTMIHEFIIKLSRMDLNRYVDVNAFFREFYLGHEDMFPFAFLGLP